MTNIGGAGYITRRQNWVTVANLHVIVGTTAILLVDSPPAEHANLERRVIIFNASTTANLFVGRPGATTTHSFPIIGQATLILHTNEPIHAIASAVGTDVRVWIERRVE